MTDANVPREEQGVQATFVSGTYLLDLLTSAGIEPYERRLLYAAALPAAKVADGPKANPLDWMAGDHPTRVNLILEQLGYEVRL
jgi:hypothetical protein